MSGLNTNIFALGEGACDPSIERCVSEDVLLRPAPWDLIMLTLNYGTNIWALIVAVALGI